LDCRRIETQDMIERYLHGRLSEQEETAFEQHYLGCGRCFAELQMKHAAALELSKRPLRVRRPASRIAFQSRWVMAAAALLVIAIVSALYFYSKGQNEAGGTLVRQQPIQNNQAILDQLAMVEQAPPYVPWTLRGSASNRLMEKFQSGMDQYRQGNFGGAIPILEECLRMDAEHQPSVYYLGISYLMARRPDDCIRELSKLAAAGSGPYEEDSRWYLAKAYLRKKDLAAARKELQAVAAMTKAHAAEAGEALRILERASR